jgi:hypothetical protein
VTVGRDVHRVGPFVSFGTLSAEQSSLSHASDHLGHSRTIHTRDRYEFGLAYALVLFDRGEKDELLLRKVARAGFAQKKGR